MGFNLLFWGFLFMFDFRLNGIDILPDVIGYILFYIGFSRLLERSAYFEKARKYAFPLIFLSIFTIYEVKAGQIEPLAYAIFVILGIVITIMNLVMVYYLCKGIIELASARENHTLVATAEFRWKLYFTLALIFMFIHLFVYIAPVLVMMVLIPLFIFSIIVLILMMLLMKQAEQQLEVNVIE